MSRLETMALMSDIDLPAAHVREQIASTVDLVVHMARLREGRRVISRVTAVEGLSAGRPSLRDVFMLDRRGAWLPPRQAARLEAAREPIPAAAARGR